MDSIGPTNANGTLREIEVQGVGDATTRAVIEALVALGQSRTDGRNPAYDVFLRCGFNDQRAGVMATVVNSAFRAAIAGSGKIVIEIPST